MIFEIFSLILIFCCLKYFEKGIYELMVNVNKMVLLLLKFIFNDFLKKENEK